MLGKYHCKVIVKAITKVAVKIYFKFRDCFTFSIYYTGIQYNVNHIL